MDRGEIILNRKNLTLMFCFLISVPGSLLLDDPADCFLEAKLDSVLSFCELRGKFEYKKDYC